jgi:hypothetical protein
VSYAFEVSVELRDHIMGWLRLRHIPMVESEESLQLFDEETETAPL